MPTTIQIKEKTLKILKKIKEDTHASSYDEAIIKITTNTTKKEPSFAGYLGKKPLKDIMKDLRNKNDRF